MHKKNHERNSKQQYLSYIKTTNRKRLAAFFALPLLVGLEATLAQAADGESGQVQISIREHEVQPKTLNISPGTNVLWRNEAGRSVRVKIISQAVSTTCKDPHNFDDGQRGFQDSSPIRRGSFASLCLLEPREYRYKVDALQPASSDAEELEGTIRVVR